jgi:hypothetical protein
MHSALVVVQLPDSEDRWNDFIADVDRLRAPSVDLLRPASIPGPSWPKVCDFMLHTLRLKSPARWPGFVLRVMHSALRI